MSIYARIVRDDNVCAIVDSDAVILIDNGVISYADTPSQSRWSGVTERVRNGDIGMGRNVKSISFAT